MEKPLKRTLGKQLGMYAFIISEVISVFFLIMVLIDYILNKKINVEYFSTLMFYQGTILTVTWGAKASSNFTKRKGENS